MTCAKKVYTNFKNIGFHPNEALKAYKDASAL